MEGCNIKEYLTKFSKFSARNHIKVDTNRLGKDALDLIKKRRIKKEYEKEEHLKVI